MIPNLKPEAREKVQAGAPPKGTWFGRIVVGLMVVFVLLPIVWLAYSSFIPKEALFKPDVTIPVGFTFQNYLELPFKELIRPLLLSLLLSSIVAGLQVLIALPAAFAIRAGTNVLPLYLFLLSVPAELLLVPLYGLLKDLNLLNNPLALVLPFLASPFTVFLLYGGVVKLPWAYVEAAKLDGATNLQILVKVIAPLLRPEMTAASVLAFAAHWNLVLYPKIVLNDKNWATVQVALTELLQKDPNNWGALGAAAMLTSLPILVLYALFERRVTRVIEGGLK
jgi:multiple sugar transport system permease protein